VGTAVLLFDRSKAGRKKDEFIWFYDMTADGFSLDDKRTPVEANDIPDVLAKWEKREEGPNSYRVPLEKILASDDLSLASGRHKPVDVQAVQHDDPQEILREVLEVEEEIAKRTRNLLKAISK
jgi:type I restriction enzyme M protein